jgi:Mn-dependent DtxR family transcriptional regulator
MKKPPLRQGGNLMNIHESAEDYLESILILKERQGLVRSIDIAHEKNFSKPSVSVAMKRLRENGFIEMDPDGYITLLPPGEEIAQRIYVRHRLLSQFLERLGVSSENAVADACKMEHDISTESFDKLIAHAKEHGLVDGNG